MNALDWVFIAVLALLAIRCMFKGFVAEVLSVSAVLVGLLAAVFLYQTVGQLFVAWGLKSQPAFLPPILGFAAVFLAGFLVIKLVERLLEEGIQAAELGGVDRALGLILGLAEGLILVSLVLISMSLLEPALKSIAGYSKLLHNSLFEKLILPIVGPKVAEVAQGIKVPELKLQVPAVKKP